MNSQNRVLLVDGMALLFRAYFATSFKGYIRKTSAGIPTNALFGFVQYLCDAIQYVKPTHVICCWDMGSTTFRTELYPSYKANRAEPPEDLVPQFESVKIIVTSMGIPNIGVVGYEADDCLGTLASQLTQKSPTPISILTGDHDMFQLITEDVCIILMNKGRSNYTVYTPQVLMENKGLRPNQIPDVKGFMGDASDNYPGVRGIGEKTAQKLIQTYQDVDGVLAHIDQLTDSIRSKIMIHQEMLILSKKLAIIRRDVPIQMELTDCQWQPDIQTAESTFREFELEDLLKLI